VSIGRLNTVFITGGGGGIGLATARHCAAEGLNIVLADRNADRLSAAVAVFEGPVLGVVMDVAKTEDWTRAVDEAEARFGAVDVLINGAAIPPALVPILDMTIQGFDDLIRTNLASVFYGTRAFGPAMRERGYGHIVNVASEAGLVPMALLGDYGAAKFGVVGFSEILRLELAPEGVGVSVVAPGLTETNMTIGMGMEARWVGKAIVEGIRANAAHVITHPGIRSAIEQRTAALLSAIGEPAQPGWITPPTRWK
jgi:NAD(P)-dependent dehydrogenase (short-subunit alcohol dehydrogenase family)